MSKYLIGLDDALKKLQDVGDEEPKFKEDVLEGFILLDLFRDVLRYDATNSQRQQGQVSSGKREIPDLLLKLILGRDSGDQEVIVEIKRYGHFTSETKRIEAIKQVARYLITRKRRFGIVTDGASWTYLMVTPSQVSTKREVAKRLVEFNIEQQPEFAKQRLALTILSRSHRKRLLKLLEILAALYESMTPEAFARICEHWTIEARVKAARNRQGNVLIPENETPLLRLLLHKDNLPAPSFFEAIKLRRPASSSRSFTT